MRSAPFILMALLLAGCGQSGDLYLPPEPEAAQPSAGTPAEPVDESKPDEDAK